jgi:copper chaperone CopZ
MKTLRFKTNINCGGCVKAVTPILNATATIESWQVDTMNPDKILTVTCALDEGQVVELLEQAGFQAEPQHA